jgi:cold shock CspA family protein
VDGRVKWFSNEKGYGFIVAQDGVELYFHVQDIKGLTLPQNGDAVSFDRVAGPKGPKAVGISVTAKATQRHEAAARSSDDREVCTACGKKMVPRIITGPPLIHGQGSWTPVPKKSVCPFCGATHRTFPASFGEKLGATLFVIAILVFLLFFFRSWR